MLFSLKIKKNEIIENSINIVNISIFFYEEKLKIYGLILI